MPTENHTIAPEAPAAVTTPTIRQMQTRYGQIEDELGVIYQPGDCSTENQAAAEALESERVALESAIANQEAFLKKKQAHATRASQVAKPVGVATTPTMPAAGEFQPNLTKTDDGFALMPHRHRLRGFKGPNAEENAHTSGMWYLSMIGSGLAQERAQVWVNDHKEKLWASLSPQMLAMGTTDNTLGGALVPDQFEATLIDLVEEYGVFRANAGVVPMDSDVRVQPRRTGGLTPYFTQEAATITASTPTVDNVTLTARTLAVRSLYSSQISEDSAIAIADMLVREVGRAFALREDQCGFLGTGAETTYGGISGLITAVAAQAGSVYTTITGNLAFSSLDLLDFHNMMGQLPQYALGSAKWYISQAGWAASMLNLLNSVGGLTRTDLEGAPGMRFLGFPVVLSQVMNSTLTDQAAANGICYFGDLEQAALFGDRRGVRMLTSEHRHIETLQSVLVASERFDINVDNVGDASTAGSIIMMKIAAS